VLSIAHRDVPNRVSRPRSLTKLLVFRPSPKRYRTEMKLPAGSTSRGQDARTRHAIVVVAALGAAFTLALSITLAEPCTGSGATTGSDRNGNRRNPTRD